MSLVTIDLHKIRRTRDADIIANAAQLLLKLKILVPITYRIYYAGIIYSTSIMRYDFAMMQSRTSFELKKIIKYSSQYRQYKAYRVFNILKHIVYSDPLLRHKGYNIKTIDSQLVKIY